MKSVRDLCSRRTVIALFLGQVVSLLITSTGFSSSELARRGINVPTSQSLLNYVLLAIVFGSIVIHRGKGLRARWYYYVLLAFVDVEANYLVVRAYQYTSITSVMLLDCWTIPCVIFLTWLCLKTKYKISQFIGVFVCVAGLVLVVFSDVHASDRQRGSRPVLGDMLVIGGSMLYAISNVSEEFFVKNVDRVELMAMLGLFGATISACQVSIFERHALSSTQWSPHDVLPFIGYAVALFCFYVLVPILLKISGAALLNLSLLTSDMWAVFIRIFAYNQKVDWMYFLAFGAVAIGLLIYSSCGEEETVREEPKEDVIQDNTGYKPVNEDPNSGDKAEEELLVLGAPKERNGNDHLVTINNFQHEAASTAKMTQFIEVRPEEGNRLK